MARYRVRLREKKASAVSDTSNTPGVDEFPTTDDFDPAREAGATPFGVVIGTVPMGTLREVAGRERARKAMRLLERNERDQEAAVLQVLGRRRGQ